MLDARELLDAALLGMTDEVGQLAALLVAHIVGVAAGQTIKLGWVRELAQVEPLEVLVRLAPTEQRLAHRRRHRRFAHSGRAGEEQPQRSLVVIELHHAAAQCARHHVLGQILAIDASVQCSLHLFEAQPRRLRLLRLSPLDILHALHGCPFLGGFLGRLPLDRRLEPAHAGRGRLIEVILTDGSTCVWHLDARHAVGGHDARWAQQEARAVQAAEPGALQRARAGPGAAMDG